MYIHPMKNGFPELTTGKYRLRQILRDDQPYVFRGLSHPEVIKYYGISFSSLTDTRLQMEWYENLLKEQTGIWWAICSREDESFLGAAGFNDINNVHHKGEIGFWLLPEFFRQGIMRTIIPVILDYAFRKLGLHRIEAIVETENIACRKLLSGLGFTHEGTFTDYEFKNGKYISVEMHACIDPNR